MNRPFEQLGELVSKKKMRLAKHVVRLEPGESDEQIFFDAMNDVKEIKEYRDIQIKPRKCVVTRGRNDDLRTLRALEEIVRGKSPIRLSDTQEYVEWVNPKCRADIVRKLHEGLFSIQDSLDLHGFTVEEAAIEVDRFIAESLMRNFVCVKIIHGRGLRSPCGPVIKGNLCGWLQRKHRKHVAGFVSARGCDGGLGATYVILKK